MQLLGWFNFELRRNNEDAHNQPTGRIALKRLWPVGFVSSMLRFREATLSLIKERGVSAEGGGGGQVRCVKDGMICRGGYWGGGKGGWTFNLYEPQSETKQLLFLALFMPFKSFEIHVALLSKWPTQRTLLQETFPNWNKSLKNLQIL